jgi:hypothetical protein
VLLQIRSTDQIIHRLVGRYNNKQNLEEGGGGRTRRRSKRYGSALMKGIRKSGIRHPTQTLQISHQQKKSDSQIRAKLGSEESRYGSATAAERMRVELLTMASSRRESGTGSRGMEESVACCSAPVGLILTGLARLVRGRGGKEEEAGSAFA